jgi:ABC-type cobalamin/Fe3+-siderophores transport system ATPase subunit
MDFDTEYSLLLENVGYDYNGIRALDSISLTVRPGTLTALIGPNGCGKTTLLKIASGLLDFDHGSVRIMGSDIRDITPMRRSQLVSFAPSGVDFTFNYTVLEVVSQGRSPHLDMLGNLTEKDHEKIDWAISRLTLQDFTSRGVNQLSQGEKERVVIARHLAQDAPVMLFDENLAHLDLKHRISLMKELKALADEGKSVIVAMHDIEFAARFFQRAILMRGGVILKEGGRDQIFQPGLLREAYELDFKLLNNGNPDEISIIPSMPVNLKAEA